MLATFVNKLWLDMRFGNAVAKCVKFGTKSTHYELFLSKCVYSVHLIQYYFLCRLLVHFENIYTWNNKNFWHFVFIWQREWLNVIIYLSVDETEKKELEHNNSKCDHY